MGSMLIVVFLGNIIRTEIRLRKAGVGGIKGRYKSSPLQDLVGVVVTSNRYNPLKFNCMNCGKEHNKIACPKCGSKAVKTGYGL